MVKKYIIDLTEEEREQLIELTQKGHQSARKIKRAHMLLLADGGKTDAEIAESLHTSIPTVERTRKKFVDGGGLESALNEGRRPGRVPALDAKGEAILTNLAQSDPPTGHKRWTLRLLTARLIELHVVDHISPETVRSVLKKTG